MIKYYKNYLTDKECDHLIETFNNLFTPDLYNSPPVENALELLDVEIVEGSKPNSVKVQGKGRPLTSPKGMDKSEELTLFLGNAGTAMRPLTAVLCAGKGNFRLEIVLYLYGSEITMS